VGAEAVIGLVILAIAVVALFSTNRSKSGNEDYQTPYYIRQESVQNNDSESNNDSGCDDDNGCD